MVLVAVLNIMVAAALPLWTQQIKRDKEEELIFRGLQYAEAIRLFQTKVGRYPVRLEELLEIEPRSIRQLWKDPMTDSGEWGLVFAAGVQNAQTGGAGQAVGGRNIAGQAFTSGTGLGQEDEDEDDEDDDDGGSSSRSSRRTPRRGETVTTGPISGVHSLSDDDSVKLFLGATNYKSWIFTPDIIPIAPTAPGEITPSLNSKWIGRPFPEGVEPAGGTGLEDSFDGDEDEDEDADDRKRSRKDREERRNRRSGGG